MKTREQIKKEIAKKIQEYYSIPEPKPSRIDSATALFDHNEATRVMTTMLDGWITQGKQTREFENEYAKFFGTKYAFAVNSGSSANYLAVYSCIHKSLGKRRISPGSEVITTSVTFPTSVFPILQVNAVPVFVDVDPESYCLRPDLIEKAISRKTKAILPVHLMGHPCDMVKIMEIARKYDLLVIEDACESHGSKAYGKYTGTFGDFGTFSFFAAHHMTTGEGGMVVTSNDELADLANSIRAFGRITKVSTDPSKKLTFDDRYIEISKKLGRFDIRQTFTNLGFAFKVTDLQSAIGIEQLKKLPDFIQKRRENAEYMKQKLSPYEEWLKLPSEKPWAYNTHHHFTVVIKPNAPIDRLELVRWLEEHNIETRPIEAGNMIAQPCMEKEKYEVYKSVPVSEWIGKNGFFFGCHPGLTKEDMDYIISTIHDFLVKEKLVK